MKVGKSGASTPIKSGSPAGKKSKASSGKAQSTSSSNVDLVSAEVLQAQVEAAAEADAPNRADKIAALSNQIESGEYSVEAEDIAKKIVAYAAVEGLSERNN